MEQNYTQYAYSYRSNGIKLLAKFVFKLSAFRLWHTCADRCATAWLPYQ